MPTLHTVSFPPSRTASLERRPGRAAAYAAHRRGLAAPNLRDAPIAAALPKPIALALAALCLSGTLALAEQKPSAPPRNEGQMPPVSITVEEADGKVRCAPADLRLPAESNVQFEIVNTTKQQVSLTAPRLFQNQNVLHHDGDLVHVASNDGYLIKQGGTGILRVRTLPEGQYPYGCTSVSQQSEPFRGTLTLTKGTQ